jgi:hypothetical protein
MKRLMNDAPVIVLSYSSFVRGRARTTIVAADANRGTFGHGAFGWAAYSTSGEFLRHLLPAEEGLAWARGWGDDVAAALLLARSAR